MAEINVTFAQFQAVVNELGPHAVVVWADGTGTGSTDADHVGNDVTVLSDKLGGGVFSWNGFPTVTEFVAAYPNAIRVTAVVK